MTCDQDHGYKDEQRAFNAGAMNEFPETVGVGAPPCLDYGKGKGLVNAASHSPSLTLCGEDDGPGPIILN